MKRDGVVVVRGGGDLGSGVVHRLVSAGYNVVVLETDRPLAVRRLVSFAQAVIDGETTVEGLVAKRATLDEMGGELPDSWIPVIVDPEGEAVRVLAPDAIVDARMAKRNLGTSRDDARVTIGLGPGFEAGRDVDLVIETMRGHDLGRVIVDGPAAPNTGVPGVIGGAGAKRVVRSPGEGTFEPHRSIGDTVEAGDSLGRVGGLDARASLSGLVRGLVSEGTPLRAGEKVGDVDPRGAEIDPAAISDKARAIGGAVLEALLSRGVLPSRARGRG